LLLRQPNSVEACAKFATEKRTIGFAAPGSSLAKVKGVLA
jgi:hypothetical protein